MKRMTYLDGLKGYCAISVCIFHFLLMFAINGYISWSWLGESVEGLDAFTYYFDNFPYSILTNNAFPLYIFFSIISFIICFSYLKDHDDNKLKGRLITRYFRFLPIVVISCTIIYVLIRCNLCPVEEYYNLTGNTWALGLVNTEYNVFEFILEIFFLAFFRNTQILSPFWCLHYLFLGSILSYVIMFIYDKVKNKYILFGVLILFSIIIDPRYLAFICGMIAAVILKKEVTLKKGLGVLFIIIGCIFGLFPPVLLPSFIDISILYAIGTFFILVGTHSCFSENVLLNNKAIGFLGKESLSLIVVQFIIMQTLNAYLYMWFHRLGIDYYINVLLNFVINAGFSILFTFIYSKTVTPLTNYICNKINNLLVNEKNLMAK